MSDVSVPRRPSPTAPRPAGGRLIDSPGLVGRERECAELDRLLDGAREGRSASLVVRGGAGMGKTALLGHVADHAVGMTVLHATGVEAEYDLAFAGLHGLLWPIVDRLAQLPDPQRGALSAALGLAPGEGHDRFLVSAAVLSLLAAAAIDRPLVCLVDDAHWLDVPSAGALEFTARRLAAEGILVLLGTRDGADRRFGKSAISELVLEPLGRESALTLLERGSSRVVRSVRERLLAEAHGNPLALVELSAALSDAQLGGRAALPPALPLTARLRMAFTQQIGRLPATTQKALLVASAEETGELRVIRRAATELMLPDDALDPAEAAGIVVAESGALSFRHPLLRSAVYESAPLAQRQRAHAAVADALGAQHHGDRALWHRAMATDGPDEALADALETFADGSERRGGPASAASAFEPAAELSDNESARGRRLARAAEAAWGAGQADRARALVERGLPFVVDEARVRLLYLGGLIEGRRGWLRHGVTALRKAAALTQDTTLGLRILGEAGDMAVYARDYEATIAIGKSAAELSPSTDVDRCIRAATGAYAADLAGDDARGQVMAAEALKLADRVDDPMCLISASHTIARQGLAAEGLAYANRAVEAARERALVTALPFALQAQARALIGCSQFDRAYSAAEEGWRLALDIEQPWAAGLNLAFLTRIDALRGAEGLVQGRVAELQPLAVGTGAEALTASVSMSVGMLDLGLGRPGEALDRLIGVVAAARPESNPLFVLGLPDAVEAAARADRLNDVADQLNRFRAWVKLSPDPARLALLARCHALVDDAGALGHFSLALEHADALSPFDRARSQLLFGEWLRRHRRRADARSHLRGGDGPV